MPTPAYDIVIRGGTLATATDVFKADLGIQAGRIAAIGLDLPTGAQEIDAKGRLVLPGGVDTHCHIEQLSGSGLMSADNFETATRSAAFGGTTSVISFAAQHRGANLASVVEDYAALAKKGALIDYAFHLMVANPDEQTVTQDLPALIRAGHRSVKVFMTYDAVQVDDGQLLDVLMAARSAGALVCVHAENHGLLKWMGERLMKRGYTAPKYHSVSHPADLHLPRLDGRGRQGDPRGARARRQDLCRDLPALSLDDRRRARQARHRGREMDVQPATAHSRGSGSAVAGLVARRSADDLVRPCALSFR
jgi:dihydropyrimidinase